MDADQVTVIYDGECAFCRRWIERLRELDEENVLELVPSQRPGVRERFPSIPEEAYGRAIQLIEPNGRIWEGAGAVERLCSLVPSGRRVAWIYRLPLARPLSGLFYGWISRNRALLGSGCEEHCRTPGDPTE